MNVVLFLLMVLGWIAAFASITLGPVCLVAASLARRRLAGDVEDLRKAIADVSREIAGIRKRAAEQRSDLIKNGLSVQVQGVLDAAEEAIKPFVEQRTGLIKKLRKLRGDRVDGEEKKGMTEKTGKTVLARLLFGNPTAGGISVSQLSLWFLIGLTGLVVALFCSRQFLPGALVGIVWAVMLRAGITAIPNDPPHRGVLTFRGDRTEVELNEGWVFLLPVFEGLITVNVQKRDYDVDVVDVRSKDDSPIDVRVSVAYTPDPDRLKRFLQVGVTNIESLIDSLTQQEVRIFTYERTDWEVDERPTLRIDKNGKGVRDTESYMRQPYQMALALRRELVDLLFNQLTEAENGKDDLNLNPDKGLADTQGWGVRFLNIYVGPIHLGGKLAEAAEKRAIENAERAAEVFEKETEWQAAQALVTAAKASGVTLDDKEALRLVLDYKATNAGHGFALPGMSTAIAEIVTRLIARR